MQQVNVAATWLCVRFVSHVSHVSHRFDVVDATQQRRRLGSVQVAPLLSDITQRLPQHRRVLQQHAMSSLASLRKGIPHDLERDQSKLDAKFYVLENEARFDEFALCKAA